MNSLLVSLAIVAGSASAQQITMPPTLNLGSVNMGAVNLADASACSSVVDAAFDCLNQDIMNAPADEVLACACCAGSNNLYSAYSACSEYLEEEMPSFTSEASAYGDIWPLCSAQAECSGSVSASGSSSDEETLTTSEELEATGTATLSDLSEVTELPTSATDEDIPTGCASMASLVTTCMDQTEDFLQLEFTTQASCFCCRTRGGRVIFNDELDGFASECVDWASTGEPDTIYPVASLYAGFCDSFSDACDSETTTTTETSDPESTTETETETTETETEAETTGSETSTDSPDGAGPSVRVGAVTAFVGAIALLCAW